MLAENRKDIMKIIVFLSFAFLTTLLALNTAGLVSFTYATRLAVHSLLAYWASIPLAVLAISTRTEYRLSKVCILSGFFLFVIAQIDHAIEHLIIQSVPIIEETHLYSSIIELLLFSILLLTGILLLGSERSFETRQMRWLIGSLILLLPLGIYGILKYLLSTPVSTVMILTGHLPMVVVGIFILVLCTIVIRKYNRGLLPIDFGYFSSACYLLAGSIVLTSGAITHGNDLWVYGESLLIASFFLFSLAIGVPTLRRLNYNRIASYAIVVVISIAAYIPLLVATILESFGLSEIGASTNYLAYTIIHLGVGLLAGIMAVLVFAYSRLKSFHGDVNYVLLFVVWTSVAFTSMLSTLFLSNETIGETIVPYFIGDILTIALLYSIQNSLKEATTDHPSFPASKILVLSICASLSLLVGELINQFIIRAIPLSEISVLPDVMLLFSNFIVMFGYVGLIFLLAQKNAGKIAFEIATLGFLTFWIVPITLKSIYRTFTIGWWASEILLFSTVLLGPAILVIMYLGAARDERESFNRARLYADLLMHDISNHNQMTLTTLELIASKSIPEEEHARLLSDARSVISLTDQLIENVRLMNESDNWAKRPLSPTNLIAVVVNALDVVTHSPKRPDSLIRFKPEKNRAFILGNELLFGAILNLLYVVLEIPSSRRELTVELFETSIRGMDFWTVAFEIPYETKTKTDITRKIGTTPIGYIEGTLGFSVARMIIDFMDGFLETSQLQADVDQIDVTIALSIPKLDESS